MMTLGTRAFSAAAMTSLLTAQFMASNRDSGRGVDADSNLFTRHCQYRKSDVIAQVDLFAWSSTDYEHRATPS
jgi:hypothetical protein